MKTAVFDTHWFDRETIERANEGYGHDLRCVEPRLTPETATLAHEVRPSAPQPPAPPTS